MSVRTITVAGLLLAMTIVLDKFPILIPGTMNQIKFTFIPNMIFASLYDLPSCVIFAIAYDTLSIIGSPYPYFPGYVLSKIVTMCIYYLFFHKEINLKNIIFAKTLVNVLCNVLLGSLWLTILYSKGFIYYFTTSLTKNLIMLPLEIFIMWVIYKGLKPVLKNFESH